MSKIVSWGHWIVGTFFILLSARMLLPDFAGLPKLIQLLRHYPPYMTYFAVDEALTWVLVLICGLGILRWWQWARILGIVLSAYLLALFADAWIDFHPVSRGSWRLVLLVLTFCGVLIWLFLPAVRVEYLRRKQIA